MLFGPEQFRDPDVDGGQAVEWGVAGRADRNQEIRVAVAGMPVMDVEAVPCSAAGAPKMIAQEDVFPVAAEVIPRVPAHPITFRAQFAQRPAMTGVRSPQAQNSDFCRERAFRRARRRRFWP
jgi:hypothetical protein